LAIYTAGKIGEASFPEVVTEAIAAGGDTDTIASMTGQIAGTWVGLRGISPELVERLPSREDLLKVGWLFTKAVVQGPRSVP
jgi:ADP-ribosylglycohydrolase